MYMKILTNHQSQLAKVTEINYQDNTTHVFHSLRNDPHTDTAYTKAADKMAYANSAESDQEQSDQGQHYLPWRNNCIKSISKPK